MTDPSTVVGTARPPARRTLRLLILTAVAVGALAGTALTYGVMSTRGVPAVMRAMVAAIAEDPNGNITAIALRFDDHHYVEPGEGESVAVVADVFWTDVAGQDHEGDRPACLPRGSYGQRVEVGVVDLHGKGFWPTQVVVWVHCLS